MEHECNFYIPTSSFADGTDIVLCGCSSSTSPAIRFPAYNTPLSCLQSTTASSLVRRTLVFSSEIGTLIFTCTIVNDQFKNPHQDCINTMTAFCNPTYIGNDATRRTTCRTAVDDMVKGMGPLWNDVRRECGQWPFNGVRSTSPEACVTANNNLMRDSYYVGTDGTRIYVGRPLIDSLNQFLWGNTALKI